MLQHLILILDDSSSSFCCYPHYEGQRRVINLATVRKAVLYAQKHDMSINCLVGGDEIDSEILAALDVIPHNFISSCNRYLKDDDDVQVVDLNASSGGYCEAFVPNVILRFEREALPRLEETVTSYLHRCRRVNLCLTDVEHYTEADFQLYSCILKRLDEYLLKCLTADDARELNVVTDRLRLDRMNNCNAGVENITVGPDGLFYICPGYYTANGARSVGSIDGEPDIPLSYLLTIDNAPICRRCDAFHCRRCIWNNERLTRERNTPSHEQCVVAHIEREATRLLLNAMPHDIASQCRALQEIDYVDPINLIINRK